MGNFQNKENINLANELDYIAANYIINNKDEIDFTKDTECIKLVEKVSAYLKKNLNGLQANYLLKTRVLAKNVSPANANANASAANADESKKCADISTIAKFYVKIANIFGAITTSVYTQPLAPTPTTKYFDKPYNFCSERLKNLLNGQDYTKEDQNKEMIINPNVCKMNKNSKNELNNLAIEPGIPALHKLYYDVYDIQTGEFVKMSEEMKRVYQKDVKTFYKTFYGDTATMPENMTFFSDITLTDYAKDNSGCAVDGIYTTPYKGSLSDTLFRAYATHIKKMEARMINNQNKLLKVLDELFTTTSKKKEEKEKMTEIITLNPDLNDRKLERLAETTRTLIIQLFITCENDYKEGIKIYQQIVDNQLKNLIPGKVKKLKEEMNQLMASSFAPAPRSPAPQMEKKTQPPPPSPPKKIAYDFDGVIHTYVSITDKSGQRGALTSNIDTIVKNQFVKIINQIKDYFKKGNKQYIISARSQSGLAQIIDVLRKLNITAEMIPDENVLSAWSDVKWKEIEKNEINEYYDDSCIVINSIQQHRETLPSLDKLYLVFPENSAWIEIEKNRVLDLDSCLQIKYS